MGGETVFATEDWESFAEGQRSRTLNFDAHFLNLEEGIQDLWEEMWEARRELLPANAFRESHRTYLRSTGQQ
jgi:hypothetical protein